MRNFCLQIIWVDPDACRLLANNLGSRHLIQDRENPRLCRGGSRSLTVTGVHQGDSES